MSTTNATRRSRRLTSPSARRAAPVAVPSLTTSLYATGFRSPPASWVGSARHDRARPRRRLQREARPDHRGPRLYRLDAGARARRDGQRGRPGRLAHPRVRRQSREHRRDRGSRSRQHLRRPRRAQPLVPRAGPGRPVQPRRPDEPSGLDGESVHGPRDQLPQPAFDPRGLPPVQPRDADRVRGDPPDLRSPAVPPGRRAASAEPGRRERHQQDRGRVVPPALRRRLRHPRHRPAADEHVRAANAHQGREADVPRLLVQARARRRGDPGLGRRAAEA